MKKVANLVNIKIDNDKVANIEILYKTNKDIPDIRAYLKDDENKYEFIANRYSFSQDIDYIKLTVKIDITKESNLKFVLIENNQEYDDIEFLDNKDEKINELDIIYRIFTKQFIFLIDDKKGQFVITKRKAFDKLKYEFSKTVIAKKKYNKWYMLNLLKTGEKYYLLNDRIMYGDDNAEQLFRYINEKKSNIKNKTYFVLDKNSPNIKEIKKVGKVLKYGSVRHKIKYINSKMVISSHASYYDRIFNPFTKEEMSVYKNNINKQFVFLQHGVIMNDVHNILNREHILADLFITSTLPEYEDVKQNYMYDKEQIVCTGLARFDRLIDERKKYILVAPTWRAFLTNAKYTSNTGETLEQSEFYQKYESLLNDKDLLKEVEKQGYKIKFLLHPACEEYKESFLNLKNDNVEILSTKDVKYSTLFKECSLFITDYSSTHFDVAFLQKPIIYYQFDQEKFFNNHYARGYFDYKTDGFGNFITEEKELVNKIIFYITNDCKIEPEYQKIIENTFCYLDHNNAKRILEEILKIDIRKEKNDRFNNVH